MFEANNQRQMEDLSEISRVFPMMHEVLQVKNPHASLVKRFIFAEDCCKYDTPGK